MKLIHALLIVGMLAVSGWAEIYSPELVKKAEGGDAEAQTDLGACYYEGKGVTQDYKEAVKWWTKSAEHGNAGGQCVLGICYYMGDGVTQDYKEAVKWFTKSAEQGDQTGQLLLAKCYERGVGVAKDPKEALKRYIKASEKKTPGSLYYVAKSFQVIGLSGEDSERSEEGFKELSNLSFRGRGDIDNAFIGLGCMEVGAFDRAKEALFNSGNSFAPFSQNIDPKSMSLLLKDSPFRDSVVEILCGDMETIGSGIFCGPDGLILTAAHVIAGQKEIHIRNAKMQTWVVQQICPGDFTQDLALIKTDARNHPYIQLADDDPEKGDEVKVIGHPLGVIHLIESTGSVRSPGSLEDIMILSNPAMPGNSGSPVFNKENQLVGILTRASCFTNEKNLDSTRNAMAVSLQNLKKTMEFAEDPKGYHPVSDIGAWAVKSPFWNPETVGDEYRILLGRTYLSNSYEERQTEVAKAIFVAEADKGNAEGIRELANLHFSGIGVQKDKKKALELWNQSANQGDVEAMLRIGEEYHSGENLPVNQREAFKWFRKSAEGGQVDAMGYLGVYYLNGWGIDSQDRKEAVKWLRKASELGNAQAESNLGICYHHGTGVGKDADEAYKCFKNAAEHGDANAQTMLGYYYQTGTVVDKDVKEAMNWYKKASLQGDEKATELMREARYR